MSSTNASCYKVCAFLKMICHIREPGSIKRNTLPPLQMVFMKCHKQNPFLDEVYAQNMGGIPWKYWKHFFPHEQGIDFQAPANLITQYL